MVTRFNVGVVAVLGTLAGFLAVASSADAGNVTFSGRNWTTLDSLATAQYEPDQSNSYATPDANTGVMTGRFGVDSAMTTAITLQVGDKVSYEYHLTEESRNFRGSGASTYVGDSRTGFQDSSGGWVSGRVATYNSRWEQYFEGNNPNYVYHPRGLNDHTTIEWIFDSATSAMVTLTLEGEGTPYATWTDSFSDIANIAQFRVGLWDSEQDVTLANFTHTPIPEPASVLLIAVGLIAGLTLVDRSSSADCSRRRLNNEV